MPSIRKHPNGRWVVTTMWPDGVRETDKFRSKHDADKAAREIEDELRDELDEDGR